MRVRNRLRTIYSGWWVLLGVTLLGIMSGGILYHGAAVFFNPIRRDLNLSSANTSLIFTLSRAQSSLAAPLYGWLVDHFGPRPLIVLGAIVASVGLVAITLTDNYILFLIAYLLLVSVPTNFGFGPTLMAAANGWFVRRKAIAMTILLTGIAAGGAIFIYPLGLGVATIGWRPTLIYSAIFVLASGLLCSRLVRSPTKWTISSNSPQPRLILRQVQAHPTTSLFQRRSGPASSGFFSPPPPCASPPRPVSPFTSSP